MSPRKSQWIRVVDVLVIGPLMIWAGARTAKKSRGTARVAAHVLTGMGVATVLFNGANWYGIERDGKAPLS